MIVSHKYRFIFMRTEKTASTSLQRALQQLHKDDPASFFTTGKRPKWAKYSPIHYGALERNLPELFGLHAHATARQARSVLGRNVFDSYFKFAVERNPWDRQVSLYFHRSWKTKRTPNFDADMRSWFYRNTEYCHLHNWDIYAIDGQIAVDRVLRYENLSEELAKLSAELGFALPEELARLRGDYRSDRPHYSTLYSDVTRDLVARWYAREIDALGYTFETPAPAAVAAT